jgi:hypothetical protein
VSPASRPVLPRRAISRVDRRGIHAWRVYLKRHGQDHLGLLHDHDHGGRAGAYDAARAWYHDALRRLPPPLRTSSRDVRCTTGQVGVSLERQVLRTGTVYTCYRAVWPIGGGRYKKRAFSLAKYGKRVAFQLAVRARRQGLARLSASLRARIEHEIARRTAAKL